MPSVSETLGAHGAPHEFELKDENGQVVDTIKFSHFVQKVKAQMERWLYSEAMKAVQEIEDLVPKKKRKLGAPDPALEIMTKLTAEKACGRFSWTSERMMNAITTITGISKLLSIVSWSKTKHRPLEPGEIEKIFLGPQSKELTLLFGSVFQESSPSIQKKREPKEPVETNPEPESPEEELQGRMANL